MSLVNIPPPPHSSGSLELDEEARQHSLDLFGDSGTGQAIAAEAAAAAAAAAPASSMSAYSVAAAAAAAAAAAVTSATPASYSSYAGMLNNGLPPNTPQALADLFAAASPAYQTQESPGIASKGS